MSLLIVGSVALDTVETKHGTAENVVGGSAVYAAYAASLFTKPCIVGVAGDDFPAAEIRALKRKGVDVEGLEIEEGGRTFRWGGRYFEDMNQRETLFTELNLLADFQPKLPASYTKVRNVFLANIDPDLQLEVLGQMQDPRFVVCDTMNLWIDIKRKSLQKLLKKIDCLLLNDEEARMLTDTLSLTVAAERLFKAGIPRIIIKKGEHGCLMFSKEGVFSAPALALRKVVDPTGAGDSFAGGMLGYLARRPLTENNWRKAILAGTAVASFCCEDFSAKKLRTLKKETFQKRADMLRAMIAVGKV